MISFTLLCHIRSYRLKKFRDSGKGIILEKSFKYILMTLTSTGILKRKKKNSGNLKMAIN